MAKSSPFRNDTEPERAVGESSNVGPTAPRGGGQFDLEAMSLQLRLLRLVLWLMLFVPRPGGTPSTFFESSLRGCFGG